MKKLILLILFGFFNLFAQQIEFDTKLPEFVIEDSIHFGKNIQFCISRNDYKYISISGQKKRMDSLRKSKENDIDDQKTWKSILFILDDTGKIIAKKQFPCFIKIDSVEGVEEPLILVTKTVVEGNDFVSKNILLLSQTGEQLSVIENPQGYNMIKSIKDNCIVLNEIDVDFSNKFLIYDLLKVVKKYRTLREHKNIGNYNIEFTKPPTGFLMIGGIELDYVVAFNRTIWVSSIKSPGLNYWKIDDIGAEIKRIRYLGYNLLGVNTSIGLTILDLDSGAELISFSRNNLFIKENRISLRNLTVLENRLVFKGHRKNLIIENINLRDKKTFQETIIYLSQKEIEKTPRKNSIKRINNGITYELKIVNKMLQLSSKLTKEPVQKKSEKLSILLSELIKK